MVQPSGGLAKHSGPRTAFSGIDIVQMIRLGPVAVEEEGGAAFGPVRLIAQGVVGGSQAVGFKRRIHLHVALAGLLEDRAGVEIPGEGRLWSKAVAVGCKRVDRMGGVALGDRPFGLGPDRE